MALRILQVHNRYQQRGGEDSVVLSERKLLTEHGFTVELMEADNEGIHGLRGKLEAAGSVFYNFSAVSRLRETLQRFKPGLVHVHNWFPSLSPGIFRACRVAKIPVVHTLHNYRLLCSKAVLFRDGAVCEQCMNTTLRLPGIRHGCYQGSRAGTAIATAAMLSHWRLGTWSDCIDRFIVLTEFAKRKMIEGGLPAEKLVVKPNFLDFEPDMGTGDGNYFIFVGRLSEEKGILMLLDAWRSAPHLPTLKIVGTGPQDALVKAAAGSMQNVELLGTKNPGEVLEMIGKAKALICPSQSYEGMPRVIIEAFAVGTPVIASRIGGYPEMIKEPDFGFLFDAGKSVEIVRCVERINASNRPGEMRRQARLQFEKFYTGTINVQILSDIYRGAMDNKP